MMHTWLSFLVLAGLLACSAQAVDTPTAADQPAPDEATTSLMEQDWAQLKTYRAANAALAAEVRREEPRVVFMGNSITEGWDHQYPEFFKRHPNWINRGISGQTTPQMLVRFRPDVLELDPAAVVVLAGINDIAGNTGQMSVAETFGNIASMAELAQLHNIEVVLASVLPAYAFPWRPGIAPAQSVVELNELLRAYAAEHGHTYLDYFTPMADDRPGLRAGLHEDEVHPNRTGYELMAPLTEQAIAAALDK